MNLKKLKPTKMEKIVSDSEDEISIERAMSLRNEDKRKEALEILIPLAQKYKNSSVLNGLIGMNYSELENHELSAFYFKKTTRLNPNSELASLGLFHSLWDLSKYKDAFKEMDNFLSKNKAKLYKVTLKEQFEQLDDKTPKYQREILEKHSSQIKRRK